MNEKWLAGYFALWDGASFSCLMDKEWQAGWITASREVDFGPYELHFVHETFGVCKKAGF